MIDDVVLGHARFLYYSAANTDLMSCAIQAVEKLAPREYFEDTARMFDITVNEAKNDYIKYIFLNILSNEGGEYHETIYD